MKSFNPLQSALLFLFVTCSVISQNKSLENSKPNIIFLMTDDQRWDNFGCYGRPEFKTANIDRLADEGVVFDRVFYPVAICMPSRATMMSGRYLSNHKVGFSYPNNLTFSKTDFEATYPAQLKQSGYRTGFVGKFGFAVTDTAYHAKGGVSNYDLQEHLGKYFDYFAGKGVHFRGAFKAWPEDARLNEIYDENRPLNERTLKTGDAMLHFLDTQPKDKPFCLSVSFYAVKNDKDIDMYPPHVKVFENKNFSVPENWVEGKNTKLPELLDHWRGVPLHMKRTSTPELYQKLVRRFATQGYTVDQQVGRLIEKLEDMGILDNTIIIYTSDNGRFHGSQGLYDKAILYEESIKAPLIVFDGRKTKEKRGYREDAFISSVDIAPTILSFAGIETPGKMQGKSFTDILDQTQNRKQWQKSVYSESLFISDLHSKRKYPDFEIANQEIIKANKSYRSRGVRDEKYKYLIYYEHQPVIEELYDLDNDPHEMNNVVSDKKYAKVLKRLRIETEKKHKEIQ
ncbi:sulfatase-like hydrolase/transferase [Tamlana agarivorans]|uniref:Sulfatase-like hydrolase/transferase n=1 Tax=Pseudotamlana agarivorans TaxID=481183 RepID=A0ACC5U9I2_9FLAO|nr:sulfatase-like hydrolase/transferase [Tamlana agarivorans]MBU2950888.1 sulfatase-like hydrolase/transferase [Tamlana agarivorans]